MKVLCEKEKAAIRKNLKRLLNILDDTNILTTPRKAWLVDRVCEFNTQAFLKFIKGQQITQVNIVNVRLRINARTDLQHRHD